MADELLTIGRFARLSGLSIGALRHYDALGLLVPASVDAETGYRRYQRDQLERARSIGRLRELELSLDDIAVVLDSPDELARLDRLRRHRGRIEARLAREQRVLHRLRMLIEPKEPAMPEPASLPELDPTSERQLAAGLFNHVWTLIEREDRTPAERDRMIHAAHASRFHWEQVEHGAKLARGEWLCSRVYSVIGRAEPALWHARRCLAILEAGVDDAEDWDLPGAYEALARAHATAGLLEDARAWRDRGRAALDGIAGAEDRELIASDLASLDLDDPATPDPAGALHRS